jgi:hypothetical protein
MSSISIIGAGTMARILGARASTGDLTMAHRLEGAALLMVAPALGQASKDNNLWLGINTVGCGRTS